jgi:dipeptidase E
LIEDLNNLKKQNFKSIDIADISALDEKIWKQKIEAADVLYFEGGNSYHLMEWISKSGLGYLLPDLLKTKVYVGVSAGSMVASKDLNLKISQSIYEEDLDRLEELGGLNFIDFYILPHLNSPYFEKVRESLISTSLQGVSDKVYALDDNSALKVDGDTIQVVSEGAWLVFNE